MNQEDKKSYAFSEDFGQASLTIPLPSPVTSGGKTFSELVLREPTAAELAKSELHQTQTGSAVKGIVRLISDVAGVPYQICENLPGSVMMRAKHYLTDFTDLIRGTPGA